MKGFNIGGNYKNIFFIGIGGVSMSGLAEILRIKGYNVSGSDANSSAVTKRLESLNVSVHIGHKAEHITDEIELVVYTAAVKEDNPEIIAAKQKGIKIIDRADLLGQIINNYKTSIGISGMHGKTTTTSMIVEILHKLDPSISLGGFYKPLADEQTKKMRNAGIDFPYPVSGNFRVGNSDLFIFEACEYCDSFLKFFPSLGIILNIEEDHLDYFKDIAQIRRSFRAYAENIKDILVINSKIENINEITDGLNLKIVTFGLANSDVIASSIKINSAPDFYADNIVFDSDGLSSFDVYGYGKFLSHIKTKLTGRHNIENALAAFAACMSLGLLSCDDIANSLSNFLPADRRFQIKGKHNGALIVDDYAHHPTEIKMALAGAKLTKHKKIICLFQPHTYTRTYALFDELTNAFTDADETAFVDIYAAREKDPGTVSSAMLAEAVNKTGKKANYFKSFTEAADYYRKNLTEGDLFITMGAGDVYRVGENILSEVTNCV